MPSLKANDYNHHPKTSGFTQASLLQISGMLSHRAKVQPTAPESHLHADTLFSVLRYFIFCARSAPALQYTGPYLLLNPLKPKPLFPDWSVPTNVNRQVLGLLISEHFGDDFLLSLSTSSFGEAAAAN